jgi:hypothetical protein
VGEHDHEPISLELRRLACQSVNEPFAFNGEIDRSRPKLPFGSSVGGVLLPRAVRPQPVKLHRTVPIVLLNVADRNGYLAPVSAQAAKLDRLAVTYDAAPRSECGDAPGTYGAWAEADRRPVAEPQRGLCLKLQRFAFRAKHTHNPID